MTYLALKTIHLQTKSRMKRIIFLCILFRGLRGAIRTWCTVSILVVRIIWYILYVEVPTMVAFLISLLWLSCATRFLLHFIVFCSRYRVLLVIPKSAQVIQIWNISHRLNGNAWDSLASAMSTATCLWESQVQQEDTRWLFPGQVPGNNKFQGKPRCRSIIQWLFNLRSPLPQRVPQSTWQLPLAPREALSAPSNVIHYQLSQILIAMTIDCWKPWCSTSFQIVSLSNWYLELNFSNIFAVVQMITLILLSQIYISIP